MNPLDNCYLFGVAQYGLNVLLMVSCFLLGILVISIVLMSTNFGSTHMTAISNQENESNRNRNRNELGRKLMAQLLHNNAATEKTNYASFDKNHPGHLDLNNQIRLTSILRNSLIADNYRFGSSVGKMYTKGTNKFPFVTPEMVGAVLAADSSAN
jgi:hypothetical protein